MKTESILRACVGLVVIAAGLAALPAALLLFTMALPPWEPPWEIDKAMLLGLGCATLLPTVLAGWALRRLPAIRGWRLALLFTGATFLAMFAAAMSASLWNNPL
jgi:hypothetical protein